MLKIGHRGASEFFPENTLLSFKKAFEMGASTIEFDVRQTKDGKLVVIHDKSVDRTTNGSGLVSEMTFREIRKLDAGKGEKIPTLKEALSVVKKFNGKCLVEIKEKGIEEKILDVIKKMKMEENVIITSFYTQSLKKVKELNPKIETGLITMNKIKNTIGFLRLCKAIKVNWVLPEKSTLTKKFAEEIHKWGFKIIIWLIDSKEEFKKWEKIVDGIASNNPKVFT
ncbi:MAG: glycerophosphodiester phosphodiesterase [Nanoarchaeota archaeon]|nr:glycerophosphodiester phosphodiesterase [Nanoarchaeota archaeon]